MTDESGRGLLMLDALATSWGSIPAQDPTQGKTLWFDLHYVQPDRIDDPPEQPGDPVALGYDVRPSKTHIFHRSGCPLVNNLPTTVTTSRRIFPRTGRQRPHSGIGLFSASDVLMAPGAPCGVPVQHHKGGVDRPPSTGCPLHQINQRAGRSIRGVTHPSPRSERAVQVGGVALHYAVSDRQETGPGDQGHAALHR